MNQAAHQESRSAPRQRDGNVPQVDVVHSAAAGQLVITVHVNTEVAQERGNPLTRPVPPAGFKAAIASAIEAVVDEHMPFPAAQQPTTAAEQSFEGSDTSAAVADGAEAASAAQEEQS